MIKTVKRTKLSKSVTSHRLGLEPEAPRNAEGLEAKYHQQLSRLKNQKNGRGKLLGVRSPAAKHELRTTGSGA